MARAASAGATCRHRGGGGSLTTEDPTGYREAWASPEEAESRFCPICLHVPRDAVAHSCGELFCEICWARLGAKPRCPSCRSDVDGAAPAHRDRREILNYMVFCPRECEAVFRLGDKQAHLDEDCVRRPVTCPQCNVVVTADVLEYHALHECVHREIGCPDCGMSTTPHALGEHQRDDCPYRRVHCQLCGDIVQWKDMNDHLNAEAGRHLAALIEENFALRKRCAKGEQDSVKLESEIAGLKQADEGMRKNISEMKSEYALVRQANEGLKKEVSEVRNESATVRQVNRCLKKEISEVRNQSATVRLENEGLKRQICAVKREIELLQCADKGPTQDISDFRPWPPPSAPIYSAPPTL